MKKDKSRRDHPMHKVSPHADAAGETVEETLKHHTPERGHEAALDPRPEGHFEQKASEKHSKKKFHRANSKSHHHETEKQSETPGVFLEEQQFIMPAPRMTQKHTHNEWKGKPQGNLNRRPQGRGR